MSLLFAESSRLGLHFVENFHRWSRVIAFGSLNAYRGNLFRGLSWASKGMSESGGHSFSRSFLDEFYWNFMNERRAMFQIRHDRKEIGNRNRIIAGAITRESCAFQANRLSLCITVIAVTAWDNWRKCSEDNLSYSTRRLLPNEMDWNLQYVSYKTFCILLEKYFRTFYRHLYLFLVIYFFLLNFDIVFRNSDFTS